MRNVLGLEVSAAPDDAGAALQHTPRPTHAGATTIGAAPGKGAGRAAVERAYTDLQRRMTALNGHAPHDGNVMDTDEWMQVEWAWIQFAGAVKSQQWEQASKLIADVEPGLRRLEELSAKRREMPPAMAAAAKKIERMTDAQLRHHSAADLAAMVRALLQTGQPVGRARKAHYRLLEAMRLDPEFTKQDDARGTQIAADLAGNKQLIHARDAWKALPDEQKIAALQIVLAAQCKRLNLPMPRITQERVAQGEDAHTTLNGAMTVNMDPASTLQKSLADAVDTIVHENAHRYALHLIQALQAGQLKPGTPDYAQALMFQANTMKPGGYVGANENYTAYLKEPTEAYAYHSGPATAAKIMAALGHRN